MNRDILTAGGQRVLAGAAQLAARRESAVVEPVDMLASLLRDESQATELIRRWGFEPEDAADELSRVPNESADRSDTGAADTTPLSDDAKIVLLEADQLARRRNGEAEIGTEHLLFALAKVPSAALDYLLAAGLSGLILRHFEPPAANEEVIPPTETPAPTPEMRLKLNEPDIGDEVAVFRILDAAANRTREALRVVEDHARMVMNDRFLARSVKELRHELAGIVQHLSERGLVAARDTQRDVGTTITTDRESVRHTVHDVLRAGCKRAEEGLRALEEYGKVVNAWFAGKIETVRYRFYTLEKALLQRTLADRRLEAQRLYLLVTSSECHPGIGPTVQAALEAGVRLFQLREKKMPDRELLDLARRIREWTRPYEALLVINDRPDIALLADADGVHVGQDELPVGEVRKILGPDRLVGVSTHSIEQARQAVLDGADYLGVGPTFPSSTKSFSDFPGLSFVREMAAEIALPWFAIGGIDLDNLADVAAAGGHRVAVSGAVIRQEQPGHAARLFLEQLGGGLLGDL